LKRQTIHVYERFVYAMDLTEYLKAAGVDVKLVRRYAVQVNPEHAQKAAELLKSYDPETGQQRRKEAKKLT
jgi:hypothetical protein